MKKTRKNDSVATCSTVEVKQAMAANMNADVVDEMCPAFSTTGPFQELVSHAILMDCFQAYFEYAMRIGCGITKVHFLGTQDDWDSLPKRLQALRRYEGDGGNGKWARYVDRLVPVLQQLADTRKGKVEAEFWNQVIDESHATGYGMGKPAELTGWAMRFIYGLDDKVEDINDIPDMYARTPVAMCYDDRTVNVKMYCGFDGLAVVDVGYNRQVIRPHTSFCVVLEKPSDDAFALERDADTCHAADRMRVTTTDKSRHRHHTQIPPRSVVSIE